MNKMKKFGMAACICLLLTVLNVFPVNHFKSPAVAEAATVSAYTTTEGQCRKGGYTYIKIKATSSIKSVSASASNSKCKVKGSKVRGSSATVSVKGLAAGSTSVKVRIKLKNGKKYSKRVYLTVYNVDRYNFIFKLLKKEGFSKDEALGIMANLLWETGPVNVYNKGSFGLATLSRSFVEPGNHCGSYYGMFQLDGSRKRNLKSWCKRNGYLYSSVRGQIKFMVHEMNTTETYARRMLKSADNAKEAGYYFAAYYERCATRYRSPRGITAQRLDKFF